MFKKIKKITVLIAAAMLAYSHAWATTGWQVDSYGNIKAGRSSVILKEGESTNCKMKIVGSTLSIVGLDGNTLSTSNPCTVGVRDASGGWHVHSFTTAQSVTFGSASDSSGNLFGLSAADWSQSMPWILSVITDSAGNDYFAISRKPMVATTSSTADVCQKGDGLCDTESSVEILTSGLTLASWVSMPMTQIGWFTGTYANTGTAWTFSLSGTLGIGLNDFYTTTRFHYPASQNGAVSNYHLAGTTPPTWASPSGITYDYWFASPGMVCVEYLTVAGGNCSNGTGANSVSLTTPLGVSSATSSSSWLPIGSYQVHGNTNINGTLFGLTNSTSDNTITLYDSALTVVNSNNFSNAGDDLEVRFCYYILN